MPLLLQLHREDFSLARLGLQLVPALAHRLALKCRKPWARGTRAQPCPLTSSRSLSGTCAASGNHADRLEALEHELLQVNDEVAGVFRGNVRGVRANEMVLQAQLKTAFEDMSGAIKAIERGLIASVDLVKNEFSAVTQGEKMLLQELRTKFAQVEQAVLELQRHAQAQAAAQIRQPPVQHFSLYTPEPRLPEPRLPGPGVVGGDAGAAGSSAGQGA